MANKSKPVKKAAPATPKPQAEKSMPDQILQRLSLIEKNMATITDLEALNKNVAAYLSKATQSFPRFDAKEFETHIQKLEQHTEELERKVSVSSPSEDVTNYLRAVTSYMKEVIKIEAKLIERQDAMHSSLEEIKQMLAGKK